MYGSKSDLDGEGAGAVMGGWMEHAPNAASVPGRDFKKLNRMALNAGQGLNANQISAYRKNHDARLKGGHALHRTWDLHGLGAGTHEAQGKQGKKDEGYMKSKQKIPVMHTRASLGHRHVEPPPDNAKPFKLKKFENVPGKLHVPGVISPGRNTKRE